jgi:hypothetical protein
MTLPWSRLDRRQRLRQHLPPGSVLRKQSARRYRCWFASDREHRVDVLFLHPTVLVNLQLFVYFIRSSCHFAILHTRHSVHFTIPTIPTFYPCPRKIVLPPRKFLPSLILRQKSHVKASKNLVNFTPFS